MKEERTVERERERESPRARERERRRVDGSSLLSQWETVSSAFT